MAWSKPSSNMDRISPLVVCKPGKNSLVFPFSAYPPLKKMWVVLANGHSPFGPGPSQQPRLTVHPAVRPRRFVQTPASQVLTAYDASDPVVMSSRYTVPSFASRICTSAQKTSPGLTVNEPSRASGA